MLISTAVRETGFSRYHLGPIKGSLEIPSISQQYGTRGFRGGLQGDKLCQEELVYRKVDVKIFMLGILQKHKHEGTGQAGKTTNTSMK